MFTNIFKDKESTPNSKIRKNYKIYNVNYLSRKNVHKSKKKETIYPMQMIPIK